jgi:hypothetical protein
MEAGQGELIVRSEEDEAYPDRSELKLSVGFQYLQRVFHVSFSGVFSCVSFSSEYLSVGFQSMQSDRYKSYDYHAGE